MSGIISTARNYEGIQVYDGTSTYMRGKKISVKYAGIAAEQQPEESK